MIPMATVALLTDSPFVPGPICEISTTQSGPLDGLRFAVKDLIDVAGTPTGRGNPDYLAQSEIAMVSASCVDALLSAGASLHGKTVTDEFAFSLEGTNAHYGTPLNPVCPDRIPGGSSSGSASAVAQGFVDFALGTDTGGSVRVPAAFCGIYGYRPTHGLISMHGVMPFAPSYDCIGLFARDLSLLTKVATILIGEPGQDDTRDTRELDLACLADSFDLVEPGLAQKLYDMASTFSNLDDVSLFENDQAEWLAAYRVLQGYEILQNLGQDIEEKQYRFGADIASRFEDCHTIRMDEVIHYRQFREDARARLDALIPRDTALLIPTTPSLPLMKNSTGTQIGEFYSRALPLNSIAGHAGLPQVCLPMGNYDSCPLSLSLLGRRGDDHRLLQTAITIEKRFRETSMR